MLNYKTDCVLYFKYKLVCGNYTDRKKIMNFFFYNIDNSIMDKNCIKMVFDVCKDWIGYICAPRAHSFPICYNVEDIEPKDQSKYKTDSIEKAKMYYSRIIELPCSFEYGTNNISSIERPYLFNNYEELSNMLKGLTLYGKEVMSEIVEQLSNDDFIKLMKNTHFLLIDKMMDFYYKCTFEELCDYIINGEIPKKVMKNYNSSSPNIYYDFLKTNSWKIGVNLEYEFTKTKEE